jgi:hypothetical protein
MLCRFWSIPLVLLYQFSFGNAMEKCVTTYLPNGLSLKIDGAQTYSENSAQRVVPLARIPIGVNKRDILIFLFWLSHYISTSPQCGHAVLASLPLSLVPAGRAWLHYSHMNPLTLECANVLRV